MKIEYEKEIQKCPWCNHNIFGNLKVVKFENLYFCQFCATEFFDKAIYDDEMKDRIVILKYIEKTEKKDELNELFVRKQAYCLAHLLDEL